MKLDEKKCRYCWGKRFYTVLYGIHGSSDHEMHEEGFTELPTIHKVACSRCNAGNKRKIKGVRAYWWKE